MLLLETWYNLSDCALEERINDSITFSLFLGLKIEAVSPDHNTISRFRSALTELGLLDKLLSQFNKQLSRHHISVREGVLVDASLVDTPHKPNGKISLTNGQGIVQKVITTTANRSDTKEFIPLLEGANTPQGTAGLADKGYCP